MTAWGTFHCFLGILLRFILTLTEVKKKIKISTLLYCLFYTTKGSDYFTTGPIVFQLGTKAVAGLTLYTLHTASFSLAQINCVAHSERVKKEGGGTKEGERGKPSVECRCPASVQQPLNPQKVGFLRAEKGHPVTLCWNG